MAWHLDWQARPQLLAVLCSVLAHDGRDANSTTRPLESHRRCQTRPADQTTRRPDCRAAAAGCPATLPTRWRSTTHNRTWPEGGATVAVAVAVLLPASACVPRAPACDSAARFRDPSSTFAEHAGRSRDQGALGQRPVVSRGHRSIPATPFIPIARPARRPPSIVFLAPRLRLLPNIFLESPCHLLPPAPRAESRHTVIPTQPAPLPATYAARPPSAPLPAATVKLDSQETPPPLCHSPVTSDRGRASTADSTPISTPVEQAASPHFGRSKRDSDLYFSWCRKPHELGASRSLLPESELLFEDAGDCSFPLFPESPPQGSLRDMAQTAAPIDISPPPFSSKSPQNQPSNLTFALRQAKANHNLSTTPNQQNGNGPDVQESIGNGLSSSYYSSGATPITMKDRPRRESNNMGSLVAGMSWGAGSWIRDDISMSGTSPANYNQSPSYHSSSYLPKMEAAFMKDFTCCGLILPSLHDLLRHFEETHANAPAPRNSQPAQGGLNPPNDPSGASGATTPGPTQAQGEPAAQTQHGFHPRAGSMGGSRTQRLGSDGFNRTNLSTVHDMDSLEDMEMDDINDGLASIEEAPLPFPAQQSQFNQKQSQLQPLNVNLANTAPTHQGLRTSTPTTPAASQQYNLQNNPTVSSVNTPTLGTVPMQSIHSRSSEESSHPGTPAELDMDHFNFYRTTQGMQAMGMDINLGNSAFGGMAGFDGTIDQPGKRLYSKQGNNAQMQRQHLQAAFLQQNFPSGDQIDLAQPFPEQQNTQTTFLEEHKPFKCPVIGCEKAYKNQNGLKYHKQHGHQSQQLKDNEDGTYSIVDPTTSIPYPGTQGMEKEKPYRCTICGKRYKNLNGLKYHKTHSAKCNPELQAQRLALTTNLQGMNVGANVAGAGMAGMDTPLY
ncbi:hypothetical protein BDV95DRAFT_600233 [Massariosphaeria phaeospora]|uniref:C2H2-type domain-containing protein n=1 Tax=Massariosphaeria phaeospora TaxID=100035 RepID=A0A7C8I4I3_9PLEO|nr:hypothetical protein BDV95DRAFT_600233 [Massariosphaeria phaeospora]